MPDTPAPVAAPQPAGPQLAGRRVLVTGAARGIGTAVAAAMAAAGAGVAICDRDDSVEEVAAAIEGGAVGRRCDVGSTPEVDACVEWAAAELGGLDVVVNNAGILGAWKLGETSDEQWQRVLDVNLTGVFRVTRAAMPRLLESGRGRVISMASITPIRGEARTTAYAASKGGVIGMTKALSREVAHRGVTVNAIAPGYMLTDQTADVFEGEHREAILSQVTMREFGRPDDVAGAAVYLASDAARYVTGQVMVVDGGVV
ncbi:MAG TPA: SDR family NAD(P)-dependent oxidoreductase [Solirubrobacterales bacterium]|nr:SDR family NAD(P)-dependent oxidoreductase [Solirubrobacterales bacterium]